MSEHRDSKLDPASEEIRRWGDAALGWMVEYLSSVRELRVYPQTTSRGIRERLGHVLPAEPVDFETLLDTVREVVVPANRQNGHPRMF
ncbi:MAG TPA: hypothetical protein VGP40_05065, partial [Chthoniobacterales bacterium]|nr:hypothetical protein [Chthoniobacterales bacterium]